MKAGGELGAATTRAEALAILSGTFRQAGMDDPRREARLVLRAALGLDAMALARDGEAPIGADARRLTEFAARRARGEPLSRIVGRREFWGLDFALSPDALDPRPDTETLVEAAIDLFAARRGETLRILDLGVGSGAILCALLSEFPAARGVGVDLSPGAVETARANAGGLGLADRAEIRLGDWTRGLEGPFDFVVSNPPYIHSGDIAGLAPEVRDFDPRLALDGGVDGLDAYRAVFPEAVRLLAPGGWLILEIGAGQVGDVLALAQASGYVGVRTRADLSGHPRVVCAQAPEEPGQ